MSTAVEKTLRVRGRLGEGEREKFLVIDVESGKKLEEVARRLGTVVIELTDQDYDVVIDTRSRIMFRKRRG